MELLESTCFPTALRQSHAVRLPTLARIARMISFFNFSCFARIALLLGPAFLGDPHDPTTSWVETAANHPDAP